LLLGLACLAFALAAPSAAQAKPKKIPFGRGITIGEWGPTAFEPAATRATFQRMRASHVDTVTLFVVWMQDGLTATEVRPGSETVSNERLIAAIRSARAAGLRVILRPYIDIDGNAWRGMIKPSSLDQWFASYQNFQLTFARIAQQERVDGFVIGSEMVSISGYADRWRALAKAVRGVFKGWITYQAVWNEAPKVRWWRSLDAIDLSAYFPLVTKSSPTTKQLVAGWRRFVQPDGQVFNWVEQIDQMRKRYRRPVFFGEIGYRTVAGTAIHPWEIGGLGPPSNEAQLRGYLAALKVWYRIPWFRGFQWWYLAPQSDLVGGKPGADHQPVADTLGLLGAYYAKKR